MTRFPAAALVSAALLTALSADAGAQVPDYFGPLAGEVQTRISALPDPPVTPEDKKAFKALDKVRTLLARESKKPGHGVDAAVVATCDRTLSRAFPGDETLDGLLDALVEAIDGALAMRNGLLEDCLPAVLEEGKALTSLQAALAAAEEKEAEFASAEDRAGRLKVLKGAGKASDKVLARFVAGAMAALDTREMDATVDGEGLASEESSGQLAFNTDTGALINLDLHGQEGEGEALRSILLHYDSSEGEDIAVGEAVTLGADPQQQASYTEFDRGAPSASGTLTILCYDVRTGTVIGTFDFTGDYSTGGTAVIADGRFVLRGLGTSLIRPLP